VLTLDSWAIVAWGVASIWGSCLSEDKGKVAGKQLGRTIVLPDKELSLPWDMMVVIERFDGCPI